MGWGGGFQLLPTTMMLAIDKIEFGTALIAIGEIVVLF
jgi:hypothetical protein